MRRSGTFSAIISNKDLTPKEEEPAAEPAPEVNESAGTREPAERDTVVRETAAHEIFEEARLATATARSAGAGEVDVLDRLLEDDDPVLGEPVSLGARVGPATATDNVHEPRRTIGARTWGDQNVSGHTSQADEDLASTQIIPKVGDDGPTSVALPAVEPRLPRLHAAPRRSPEQGASARGETAGSKAQDAASKKPDESELLAELKAVINRKFDELLK